jgi:hypothetical protein
MKKIYIIVSGQAQPNPGMITLLREHFPDLGIEIVHREKENAGPLRFNPAGNTMLGEFIGEVGW